MWKIKIKFTIFALYLWGKKWRINWRAHTANNNNWIGSITYDSIEKYMHTQNDQKFQHIWVVAYKLRLSISSSFFWEEKKFKILGIWFVWFFGFVFFDLLLWVHTLLASCFFSARWRWTALISYKNWAKMKNTHIHTWIGHMAVFHIKSRNKKNDRKWKERKKRGRTRGQNDFALSLAINHKHITHHEPLWLNLHLNYTSILFLIRFHLNFDHRTFRTISF